MNSNITVYNREELKNYIALYDTIKENYDFNFTKFIANNSVSLGGQYSNSKVKVDDDYIHLLVLMDRTGRVAFNVNEYGYSGTDGNDARLEYKTIGGLKIYKGYLYKDYEFVKSVIKSFSKLESLAEGYENYDFDMSNFLSELTSTVNNAESINRDKYHEYFNIKFNFNCKRSYDKTNIIISYYNNKYRLRYRSGYEDGKYSTFVIRKKHTKDSNPYKDTFVYKKFNDAIKRVINTIIDNNNRIDNIEPVIETSYDTIINKHIKYILDRNTAYFTEVDNLKEFNDLPELKDAIKSLVDKENISVKEYLFDIVEDENRYNKHTIHHKKVHIMASSKDEADRIFKEEWLPSNRGHVNYAFGSGLGSLIYSAEEWHKIEVEKVLREKALLEEKMKRLGI